MRKSICFSPFFVRHAKAFGAGAWQRFTWNFTIESKLPLRFALLRRAKLVLAKIYGKIPHVPLMPYPCPSLTGDNQINTKKAAARGFLAFLIH
jgi:hypothetical protein